MSERRRRIKAVGVLAGLAASIIALAFGPLLMPGSYDWLANTTSESGAQGLEGAWLARLGFVLFGLSTLWIVRVAGLRWPLLSGLSFVAFGALMVSVAAFAARPWERDLPHSQTEDLFHSIAAGGVGTAFIAGTVFVAFQHGFDRPPRPIEFGVAAATGLLALGLSLLPAYDGLLQRVLFLIAYAWLTRETLHATGWLGPERSHPGIELGSRGE